MLVSQQALKDDDALVIDPGEEGMGLVRIRWSAISVEQVARLA